ncbi:MAG TPA: hypothetical protein VN962_17315 [Polyangia bacterium]|nr:hypothetical protein [Polyangia bacterium]
MPDVKTIRLVCFTAAVALLGCHKSSTPSAGAPGAPEAAPAAHVDGTAHTDAVQNAWRSAGLAPEGFAPVQPIPYGASYCEEGRVQGLDTLVCEFRDQDTLAKGQSSLLEQWGREGGHTGVAYHQKLTVVGIVDRARHDPNGKVIHQVIDTFRKI